MCDGAGLLRRAAWNPKYKARSLVCAWALVCPTAALGEPAAANAEWPEFRGQSQQGFFDCVDVPTRWNRETNIVWKTAIAGVGWSQPVVHRGRVYLTTAVPQGDARVEVFETSKCIDVPISLRMLCVDIESGRIIWDKELGVVPPGTAIHPKNSHASPTPCIAGEHVFFHFGTHGTGCLDFDGNVVWKTRLEYEPQHGSGGSPVVVGDVLILNCDGKDKAFVLALSTKDGLERWRTPRPGDFGTQTFAFSTPLFVGGGGGARSSVQAATAYRPWIRAVARKYGECGFRNVFL